MNPKFDRDELLASGRRALTTIAAWANFLFDGNAGSRLIEMPLPPDGALPSDDVNPYRPTRSAGGRVEASIVLSNLGRAFDFVCSGEWRSTLEDLVGVVNALEPFRAIVKADAICGPYTDALIAEDDRTILLQVLDALLARRWLASGSAMTLPQIAALAGLSEKTIRMAAVGRGRNPDLDSYRDGTTTKVKAEEAERWLGLRQNFKPTRIHGDINAINLSPRSNQQVAILLTALREKAGFSIDQLGHQLDWSPNKTEAYAKLEGAWWTSDDVDVSLFDVSTITRLARFLQIEPALEFVRAINEFLRNYEIDRQFGRLGTPEYSK
jgi:hypothetical protein